MFEGSTGSRVGNRGGGTGGGEETVRMMLALENSRIEMRGDWKNLGMDENKGIGCPWDANYRFEESKTCTNKWEGAV